MYLIHLNILPIATCIQLNFMSFKNISFSLCDKITWNWTYFSTVILIFSIVFQKEMHFMYQDESFFKTIYYTYKNDKKKSCMDVFYTYKKSCFVHPFSKKKQNHIPNRPNIMCVMLWFLWKKMCWITLFRFYILMHKIHCTLILFTDILVQQYSR